jgi:hypothetical protein
VSSSSGSESNSSSLHFDPSLWPPDVNPLPKPPKRFSKHRFLEPQPAEISDGVSPLHRCYHLLSVSGCCQFSFWSQTCHATLRALHPSQGQNVDPVNRLTKVFSLTPHRRFQDEYIDYFKYATKWNALKWEEYRKHPAQHFPTHYNHPIFRQVLRLVLPLNGTRDFSEVNRLDHSTLNDSHGGPNSFLSSDIINTPVRFTNFSQSDFVPATSNPRGLGFRV